MTAQTVSRSRHNQRDATPSPELARWLGKAYCPPTRPIDPATFNPHPWPVPSTRNRKEAVQRAALDCLKRGYPAWHATLAIRDWNAATPPAMDLIDLNQTVVDTYRFAPAEPLSNLTHSYLRFSEHCSDTILPREWLIPGILPAAQRTAIVGKWGSGKSWLALDIAMAIAFGSKFLGDSPAALRGPVVILDGEGGHRRALGRFNQLRVGRGLPASAHPTKTDIHWFSHEDFNLSWEDAADKLSDRLAPIRPALIIMDTLAKVMGLPDENSNAAASRVTRALYALNQSTSAALLLLAHPAKSDTGETSVRGAGELSADLDVLWNVYRTSTGVRRAKCEKDRDPDLENSTIDFSIHSHETGTRLTRNYLPPPLPNPVEAAITEALTDAPSGLRRSDLYVTVKEHCKLGTTETRDAIRRLRDSGIIAENDHRLFLVE